MDVIRSRTCWTASAIVGLVILSVLIYSTLKMTTETDGEAKFPGVIEQESGLERKHLVTTTTNVTQYNPIDGFNRTTDWSDFRTHGSLSASAADFQKGEECRRIVVFLGKGVILGHLLTACDSMEPSMGLIMVDDILYYYGRAMEAQGPSDDQFTLATKIIGERKCIVTSYTIHEEDSPKLEDKSQPMEVGPYQNKECKTLINFKMPTMLLLSTNGNTGLFVPGKTSYWATVNPWEPLGTATRIYWYGARCFRLLVITSYSRSVQAVKVSCGPVQNLVVANNALYYGDALVVKRNPESDNFVIIYNPKRSGNCFKKVVSLSTKEGRSTVSVIAKVNLSPQDQDCQDLTNGKITGATLNKDEVSQVFRKLQLNSYGVEPYGVSLKEYSQYSQWSHFNLPKDLGLGMVYYKGKEGMSNIRKLLLVVAKGVPLAATMVTSRPVQRLIIREDVLIHDKDIMLRKTEEKDKFIAVVKIDEYNCFKKSYILRHESGMTVKEELPSWGEVTKSMDEDCMDLIDGNKLVNPESAKYGAETDDFGVPLNLPAVFGVSGNPSYIKGRENDSHKE